MNEALILEKLEDLTKEVQTLRKEVREAKTAPPVLKNEAGVNLQELTELTEELREIRTGLKAGLELTNDLQPIAKQLLPKAIGYLGEIDDRFSTEDLTVLITKALTSLDAMNEAMDLLKSGIDLRDELIPIAKLSYPRIQKFLNDLHEGEFQAEQLGNLLHTILLNVHTFSDLMNMLQPMTELVKEFEVVMKQTDILSTMNRWLDSMQQSNGMIKLAAGTMNAMKKIKLSDQQVNEMCRSLEQIDFSKAKPVGPVRMIKQLNDPNFQETMGAMFMIVQALGGCLQACKNPSGSME